MKICYINGYQGEQSSKPKYLGNLLGLDIHQIKLYVENGSINLLDIEEQIKDQDLIISSSTGSYISRYFSFKYNIPVIMLNPVLDFIETFKKINVPCDIPAEFHGSFLLEHLVFINRDDELIDFSNINTIYSNVVEFQSGGHRFTNLDEIIPFILDFINKIK